MQRRCFKHILSFPDRPEQEAKALKDQAHKMRPGKEREMLLRKARQLETTVHINEWLASPPAGAGVTCRWWTIERAIDEWNGIPTANRPKYRQQAFDAMKAQGFKCVAERVVKASVWRGLPHRSVLCSDERALLR